MKKESRKRKKNKKIGLLIYTCLFIIVFGIALASLSYFVKKYSPDVDVAIGNNESLTLNEPDMEVEIKSIDERLKWIQMEDEMPSVAVRNNNEEVELEKIDSETREKIKKEEKLEKESKKAPIIPAPRPSMSEIIKEQQTELNKNTEVKNQIVPAPIPTLTKVYIGSFTSIEEAMAVQQQISSEEPGIMPFIKSINGEYIVQLGSFSNKEKADEFMLKLRAKGYKPKTM